MGKKLSKLLGVFCVGLLFALCGMSASAAETQENVMYLDEKGETKYEESATVVTSEMTEWTEGWYVVNDSVTIYQDVEVTGNVNLILQGCLEPDELIDIDTASLKIVGNITGNGSLTIYGQGKGGGSIDHWKVGRLGRLQCDSIKVDTHLCSGYVHSNIFASSIRVSGGYLQSRTNDFIFDTFTMTGGFVRGYFTENDDAGDENTVIISGGIIEHGISVHSNIKVFNSTIGIIHSDVASVYENSIAVTNSTVDNISGGDISITGSTITRRISGDSVEITNITVESDDFDFTCEVSALGTVEITNSEISGDVSASLGVTVNSGTLDRVSCGGNVNIRSGYVNGNIMLGNKGQIVIGAENSSEAPVIYGDIISYEASAPVESVWIKSGTVYGNINTHSLTMYGGEIGGNVTISRTDIIAGENDDLYGKNGMIYGGVCNGITASMGTTLNVFGGNVQYVGLAAGCELNINGGTISSVYGGGNNCVVYDYTAGQALPADFKPYDMLYLSYDLTNKTVTGLLGGNVRLAQDFGVYAPSEWGDQAKMEVIILPGATATVNCFRFTGDLLVQGTLQASPDISTNPMVIGTTPYYAINADSETVASVSAGDSIVRDGVTFVPEGEVVTLKSKGTGAMHWAAQPAYLNVTNNKFYMPDEVVSVKASALPLEATPTIQVDGEKLTGFTAGEYYSISDAIFRPTGTTLPIRPEWYGTTVSIVKLGDGFATGDSFAQALAIPSQSSGTVTPPNPGGGTGSKPDPDDPEEIVIPDGDWEEAEEELSQADSGDTVIVETDEDDTLPGEVLESAAGKNVTLIIQVGTIISWEIDCREIPKATSFTGISLKVSMNTSGIPESVLHGLPGSHPFQQMTLGHDGPFGFPVKLHTNVGRENSGKWANLYYYNEESGKMEFETAARVTASGDAVFTMTHASQYAIVLDEKSHTLSFQDVKEGSWFQGAVEYVYRASLMAGTGDTTFEPNAKLTRAMTAQILYNLEGTPEVTGEATFTDMNTAPDWSMDAIAWAQDTGVVAGMGDNTFAPNLKVTRDQFAQMLYNYAKYKKCDLTKAGDLTKFPDEGSVSDWAVTALSWANGNGLINGHESGTLDPQGNTVRGQAASILMNFDLNVVKSVA